MVEKTNKKIIIMDLGEGQLLRVPMTEETYNFLKFLEEKEGLREVSFWNLEDCPNIEL